MSVNTKFLKLTNGPVQKDGPLIKRVNGNDPVLRGLEDFFQQQDQSHDGGRIIDG